MKIKYDFLLGIDPGVSNGGIVTYNSKVISTYQPLREPEEIIKLFKGFKDSSEQIICMIENNYLRESDFRPGGKGTGIAKLARHCEVMKNALIFLEIPFIKIEPKKWQSELLLIKKHEDGIDYKRLSMLKSKFPFSKDIEKIYYQINKVKKNRFKVAAQSYFPNVKVTLKNADALLILYLLNLKLKNEPDWIIHNLPPEVRKSLTIIY